MSKKNRFGAFIGSMGINVEDLPLWLYSNKGNRKTDMETAVHDGMPKTGHEFCQQGDSAPKTGLTPSNSKKAEPRSSRNSSKSFATNSDQAVSRLFDDILGGISINDDS